MRDSMSCSSTILVVDDIPANLGILTDFLSEANFEVLVAQDGESAIQKLNYTIPDLILLDVMMPGIDGFETYERLKENSLYSQIPVIFITALSETDNVVKGLSLGAVDYIIKPFQKKEVLARIKTHLQLQHLTKVLKDKNQRLLAEIEEHSKARAALRKLTQELEIRVEERTAEVSQTLQNLYKSQAQLEYNAFHDSLTGLPNRDWLIKRLQELITANSIYSVLFIDLDRFKIVNDSLGHLAGDELLKCVANRMQGCLTPSQIATRMGGDEFIILLEIEIIETCLLKAENFNFKSLKEIGVSLCIDDFCTGYSSLSMLRNLPIDTLKIDRSFVQDLLDKPNDTTLIETIILLGKSLKMEVVAEGVETQDQVNILRELGCDWVQGYFFARPLDNQNATQFLIQKQGVD